MTSVNSTKSSQTNPPRPRQPLNPFSSIKPLIGFIVVLVSLYYSLNFLRLPNRNAIPALPEGEEMSRKKCIVYHTNWANYARNFQVKDIPLQGITDIAYAFFNLQDSGGGLYKIVSGDTWADFENPFIGKGVEPQNTWSSPPSDLGLFGQFNKLHNSTSGAFNLQLSIGGWTWSKYFSLAVRTHESRSSLAKSIIDLFLQWKCFHGVSIDWEYLSNDGINYGNDGNIVDRNDPENLALFIELLRSEFSKQGWNEYTIAMCFTPAPGKIKFDVKRLIPLIDEWHIMTYDFASGAWSPTTAHQSNLYPSPHGPYSGSRAVDTYMSHGVLASKIYIGVPFYSRGFAGSNGLGSPATGASPDTSWEAGVVDYKSLPLSGAVEMWDEQAQASYSYDASRKVLNSYDNPRAVAAKCEYIKRKGLGGLIIWESSADAPYDSERSLLRVIHDKLLSTNPPTRKPRESDHPRQGNVPPPVPGNKPHFQGRREVVASPPPVSAAQGATGGGVEVWEANKFHHLGDLVSHQGKVYKCITAHQGQVDWAPAAAVSLWAQQ